MASYPSVNLEQPTPQSSAASPIVAYRAHRDCYAGDAPCSICGALCSSFADAVHADGSESGWVRVCPKCAEKHKAAAKAAEPVHEATEAEPIKPS